MPVNHSELYATEDADYALFLTEVVKRAIELHNEQAEEARRSSA